MVRAKQLNVTELADAVAGAMPDLDAADQHVAIAVYRLLAQGSPVAATEVAKACGLTEPEATAALDRWPGVFRDGEGHVVGFWGLAIDELTPTHRFELDERVLYAWCAWDTLFLPGILQKAAHVTSTCPATGETVTLDVGPDSITRSSHRGAVVSFLFPDTPFDSGVVEGFCHFVHFFANAEAGERWVVEHPDTFLLSLDEAFDLGALVNRRFGVALGGGR